MLGHLCLSTSFTVSGSLAPYPSKDFSESIPRFQCTCSIVSSWLGLSRIIGLLLASLSCSHIAVWANSSSWTTSFIFSFNRCSRPALPPVPVCKSNWFPDPQQGLFAIVALLSSFSELLAHFKVLNTSRSCSPKTGIYSNVDNLCQILHINSSNAGPLQDSCRENLAAF